MGELFYVQDTRKIVGNSVMWWAINDRGYTCDIRCAKVWTKDDLKAPRRSTDKPWPKEIVDRYVQHHIDIQDLEMGPTSDQEPFRNYPHTLVQWRPDLITTPPKNKEREG